MARKLRKSELLVAKRVYTDDDFKHSDSAEIQAITAADPQSGAQKYVDARREELKRIEAEIDNLERMPARQIAARYAKDIAFPGRDAKESLHAAPAKLFIEQADSAIAIRAHTVHQRHISLEIA